MRLKWQFKFFVITVIAALILPEIFRDGIFMDGNLYASVAVNFARGEGSFWLPHFAKDSMSLFHEQPPLMFAMLGTMYKIFGEHMLVERFYSLAIFILSVFVFMRIWKELFKNSSLREWSWMALLIWVMIPNTPWAVIHNLEENTMGFFVLLSVLFMILSLTAKNFLAFTYVTLASVSLTAAFLTKGFPGLFPLCLLPLYFLLMPESGGRKKIILLFFCLLISLTAFAFILFTWEPSKNLLSLWLNERVLNSIKNVSTTSSRFGILIFLFYQLIPVGLLAVLLFAIHRAKKLPFPSLLRYEKRIALIFLLLAVSGSFPLIVTREQRGFYLATSYPYYAIALAIYVSVFYNVLHCSSWKVNHIKIFRGITYVTSIAVVIVTIILLPTAKRDADKFHDFPVIAKNIEYGSYAAIPESMWNDWELQTGLIRENYISITTDKAKSEYLITDPPEFISTDTAGYKRMNWPLKRYVVYRK